MEIIVNTTTKFQKFITYGSQIPTIGFFRHKINGEWGPWKRSKKASSQISAILNNGLPLGPHLKYIYECFLPRVEDMPRSYGEKWANIVWSAYEESSLHKFSEVKPTKSDLQAFIQAWEKNKGIECTTLGLSKMYQEWCSLEIHSNPTQAYMQILVKYKHLDYNA